MIGADNQQETLPCCPYYFTGFCCGEISVCLLRLSNRKSKKGGVYYTPDITISNADLVLLREVNREIADNYGVISKIKGGFNLSIRGKAKVKIALAFFDKYPPIVGDLVLSRLLLIRKALEILESQKTHTRSPNMQKQLDRIRQKLSDIKKTAVPIRNFTQVNFNPNAIGYFLSGLLDAEGSVGFKSNGTGKQPFIAVAMKDVKIVELFKMFLKVGHIHERPKEKMLHFEIGARNDVLKILNVLLNIYPSKLRKVIRRMRQVKWILNDYTLGSRYKFGKMI